MPYIPINCYPHNISLEKDSSYLFFGEKTLKDYLENIELEFLNLKGESQFYVDLKNRKLFNNKFKHLEDVKIEGSEFPIYGNNNLFHCNVFNNVGNSGGVQILNNETIKLYAYNYYDYNNSGKNYSLPIFKFILIYAIPLQLKILDENSIDCFLYLINRSMGDQRDLSNTLTYLNKEYEYNKTTLFQVFLSTEDLTPKYEIPKNFVKDTDASNMNKAYTNISEKLTNGSFENFYNLGELNFNIWFDLEKYASSTRDPGHLYYGTFKSEYKSYMVKDYLGIFNLAFSLYFDLIFDQQDNHLSINIRDYAEEPWPFHWTGTFKKESELSLSNSFIEVGSETNLYNYLRASSKINWRFNLQGLSYDTLIFEGYLEKIGNNLNYYRLPISSTLDIPLKDNLNRYYSIKDNIQPYYYSEVVSVSQTYNESSNNYSYVITGKFNFKEDILPKNIVDDFQISLGGQYFDEEVLTYFGNKITFESNTPFILPQESITQNIVLTFERNCAYVYLFDGEYYEYYTYDENEQRGQRVFINPEEHTPLTLYESDLEQAISLKTNFIFGNENRFELVEPFTPPEIQISFNNKKLKVFCEYEVDLKSIQIEILDINENLLYTFQSSDNFIDQVVYPYLQENTTYILNIERTYLNGIVKKETQKFSTPQFDYETYNFCKYSHYTQANALYLSNILSLPWINSNNKLWLNAKELAWKELYEVFSISNDIILELKASIYKIMENNQQLLLADNLILEPVWDGTQYTFDHIFYDFGIKDGEKYQYEIFYEAKLLVPKEYFISENGEEGFIFKYYCLDNEIVSPVVEKDNIIVESSFNNEDNKLLYNGKEYTFSFSSDLNVQEIQLNNEEQEFHAKNEETIKDSNLASIRSYEVAVDDWIDLNIYGTKYDFENNQQNRYELDLSQKWHFNLDIEANSIDFTTERNVFINGTSIPKVGASNVNYMTQTITAKLGYLESDTLYSADNIGKLNKFSEFANDETIKIIRLQNGLLIPVDIVLKNQTVNYKVVGNPSDINFSWTQIGNHKDCVLYSVVKGESFDTLEGRGEL